MRSMATPVNFMIGHSRRRRGLWMGLTVCGFGLSSGNFIAARRADYRGCILDANLDPLHVVLETYPMASVDGTCLRDAGNMTWSRVSVRDARMKGTEEERAEEK